MYDDSKQHSLFEKFDRVVMQPVKQEVELPGDDLEFCKEAQDEFDKLMESLDHFKSLFDEFQKIRPAEKLVKIKSETFCPVENFEEKKKESKQTFINAILRYFSDKYYLKEYDLSTLCENDNLDYKMVVEKIQSEFGDLVNFGVKRLKSQFKDKFCWVPWHGGAPQLKNNKISIHKSIYYDYWPKSAKLENSAGEKIDILLRAFSYFESGDIDDLLNLLFEKVPHKFLDDVDLSTPYELGLEKIKGIKFYKNNRIDLVFNSGEYAGEFFDMFGLSNPIDNRRK